MALNYVPLSQCMSLFVANQFRVGARQTARPIHRCCSKYVVPWVPGKTLPFRSWGNTRVLYQQPSMCCWRDIQNFSSTTTIFNPHASSVRAKYLGNKTSPESQLLPFMSKTGKKKKLGRVKSCHECRKKIPSKDSHRNYQPESVSSATTAKAFSKHLKPPEENSSRVQIQNEVPVSLVAKEMVDYFIKFIDNLNKMDKSLRLQKIRDSPWNSKYTDGKTPLILPVREATKPQKSSYLPDDVRITGLKADEQKTHSKKKKPRKIDYDEEKMNPIVNQFWKETYTPKDSVKETELLEIRPRIVENIKRKKDDVNSKNTHKTTAVKNAANKEMKTYTSKDGFILVESISPKIVEKEAQLKNQNGIPCNEKGFILVYPEENKTNQFPTYCSGENGFILVKDKGKSDVNQRKSKEDSRNFVLVNDNPFCNSKSLGTDVDESKASQVTNVKDVLPKQDAAVQLHMVEHETVRCTSLNSKCDRNAQHKASSLLDNQTIGSSDSKEELQRQFKSMDETQTGIVATELSKSDKAVESQPLHLDSHKLENEGLKMSERHEREVFSDDSRTASKKRHDSANRNNRIQAENFTANNDTAVKASGIRTEDNATKKYDKLENGNRKKVKKPFQGSTVAPETSHDLHTGAFGTAVKGYPKFSWEPAQEKKKSGKKKSPKYASSFINLTTKNKTKSSAKETQRVSGDGAKKLKMGSIKKLTTSKSATSHSRVGFRTDYFKQQKSPAVAVHELKADLPRKKADRHSPYSNMALARNIEPQLFVKPEELSNKMKLDGGPENEIIYSVGQNVSPRIRSPTYSTGDRSPIKEGPTSTPMSLPDEDQELGQLYKTHSQEMSENQTNVLYGPDTEQEALKKSLSQTKEVSSAAASQSSPAPVKKIMMLSDVFQQLRHTTNTNLPRQSATTANNSNTVTGKQSSRKNVELAREIQKEWSQSFQEKFDNLQPKTVYSSYGSKCATEATQNSNTSAGSKPEKEKKTSPQIEKVSKQRSTPLPNMVQVVRKSEHLPTMGMAERLLLASQRPSGPNVAFPDVKDSGSSMNTYTDATVTKETADDFPEVDQFEEFVQNNMAEINKANITSPGDAGVGLPSNIYSNDDLKHTKNEPVDDIRLHEGTNVDGDLFTQMVTQQPETSNWAEPVLESNQLYNSAIEKTMNNSQADKNIPKPLGATSPRVLYGDKSASMTNASLERKPSGPKLIDTTRRAKVAGSAINISHKTADSPTSTLKHSGQISKGPPLSKSKMFTSLDGFACLTVVEEPQKTSPKSLKPTLKRSPSRERGEEKRVSFENTSKEGAGKVKSTRDRYDKHRDKYAGSSVDRYPSDDNVSGGNNSKESDLRNELAEERKRAEMDARIKLLNEHSKQIREYEAVLSKYRDIVSKFKDDALRAIRGQGSEKEKSSEV